MLVAISRLPLRVGSSIPQRYLVESANAGPEAGRAGSKGRLAGCRRPAGALDDNFVVADRHHEPFFDPAGMVAWALHPSPAGETGPPTSGIRKAVR